MKNFAFMVCVIIVMLVVYFIIKRISKVSENSKNILRLLWPQTIIFYTVISILELFESTPEMPWLLVSTISFFVYNLIYYKKVILNPNSKIKNETKKRFNFLGLLILIALSFAVFMFVTEVIGTSGIIVRKIVSGIVGGYVFCELNRVTEVYDRWTL